MQIRRRVAFALVGLLALEVGCAKGRSSGDGDGDGGDDTTERPDAAGQDEIPDAGGGLPDAGGGGDPVTLTHSTSMSVEADNSVACYNSVFGYTRRSSYYRVFDLAAMGMTRPLAVSQVTVGIERARSGSGNGQPATVKLHTLTGAFTVANLTELARQATTVDDQELQLIVVPVAATVPAGSTLVVEFLVPNGEANLNALFPGSNNDGQSGPTYVRDDCGGAAQPTDVGSLGFPDMHLVLSVDAITQ